MQTPKSILVAMSLAAALHAPDPVAAQDATPDTAVTDTGTITPPDTQDGATGTPADGLAPEEAASDAAASDAAPDGSPGLIVDASSAQTGQGYVAETFGDWQLRCVKAAEGGDPCQIYQLLADQSGTAVAEVTMTPVSDEQAIGVATIITPLETRLTNGLAMSIDGGEPRRFPFEFCNPQGCWVRIGMREDDVQVFRRGAGAKVQIVPVRTPDRPVDLTLSLSGFTAAWTALNDRLKSADQ